MKLFRHTMMKSPNLSNVSRSSKAFLQSARHQIKLSTSLTSNKKPNIKEYQWNPREEGSCSQHYAINYTISRLFIIKRRYGHVKSRMNIDSGARRESAMTLLFLIQSVIVGKARAVRSQCLMDANNNKRSILILFFKRLSITCRRYSEPVALLYRPCEGLK